MNVCDWCEKELPAGCRHISGGDKECPLGPRTDLPWRIGISIWKDLTDRRGVKNELDACDDDMKIEIIETMGDLAVLEMGKTGG